MKYFLFQLGLHCTLQCLEIPETPRIMNTMNVSIPKNPNGLTNLAGNENFIAVKTVLSTPSQNQ